MFDKDGIQKHFFGLKEAMVFNESLRHAHKLQLISEIHKAPVLPNKTSKTELLKEKLNISSAVSVNKATGKPSLGGRGGRGVTSASEKSSSISMYDKSQLDVQIKRLKKINLKEMLW